jgi:hypothetical protein
MRKAFPRLHVYLLAALVIAGAVLLSAQTKTPDKQGNSQSKAATPAKKPKGPHPTVTNVTIKIEKCVGGDAEGDGTFTFDAADHAYNVILYDKTVFTDCDPILKLDMGQTKACTANTAGLQPGQHRMSQYLVVPPNGLKDCPKGAAEKKGKKLGTPGDPNDITVP